MKYLLRTKSHYDETGNLEWSPGRNRWYTISQVDIRPREIQDRIVRFLGEYMHKHFKVLSIEGYYDQIGKILYINRIFHLAEVEDRKMRELMIEDEIQEEAMMFSEDIFWLEEL